jgi:hypothetical protein
MTQGTQIISSVFKDYLVGQGFNDTEEWQKAKLTFTVDEEWTQVFLIWYP